uniref:Uncharacterized protein n=1 Tax=Anguilla anguilla TaxID=7936 RepID=A0A0E9XL71_ANGAN
MSCWQTRSALFSVFEGQMSAGRLCPSS